IDRFKNVRAIVIGDLMIDEYLWGDVDRISPEAPVPVVAVKRKTRTLGGAGNVINNLVSMGACVTAIGTAGRGPGGQIILDKLSALGVGTSGIIKEVDRPTTRKTRVIASNQQVVRIDQEIKQRISPETEGKILSLLEDEINRSHLLIISDYAKGLVTRNLVAGAVEMARRKNIPVLADPKSKDFGKYAGVSLMTPNKKEAAIAANMDISDSQDLERAGKLIMGQAKLERLLITCGKDGMVLFENGEIIHTIESKARQVFDVSGAGDTVISLLGLGLAAGASFEDSAAIANAAAGIVVGKVGTATASIDELKAGIVASEDGVLS
ncbi:MAG: D-glycero-beta-D-manno-heptose-7-phosphate kinase, partial [Desulfovibrionales bacterium]|nr:D-glycero-beta-D-manno-heptose-7-phosphate kinase [Desulfovibrionales bacterium]